MIFNETKCRVNTSLGLVGGCIPCIPPPCVRAWTSCATPHSIYMDNAEEYWITARGITRLDGARGKKQVWRPHVRTWGLSEANVLHWSTCDIVRTFWRPPRSFGALIAIRCPGNCAALALVFAPMITARSDAPRHTVVLSSPNKRLREPLALGRGKIFNSPEFLRHREENE